MELWIRSQDKETLIVANHLDIYTVCFDGEVKTWNIEESGVNLGEYRTKERALEVLDEIQKIIGWIQNDMKNVTIGDYEELIGSFNNYIYEMPAE